MSRSKVIGVQHFQHLLPEAQALLKSIKGLSKGCGGRRRVSGLILSQTFY